MLWRAVCFVRTLPPTVVVPAFAPGFPLVNPAPGAAPEFWLDGAVLPLGSELVLVDGVGEGDEVVVPLGLGLELEGPGTIGGPLDACPGLYGVKLRLQYGEVPDGLGAVE